jgi:hypothetical protein
MLIRISVFILMIIMMNILAVKNSQILLRSYFIEKDFFTGIKMSEFSVFNSAKTRLLYRIESYYQVGGKFEVIDRSTKQVIGQLINLWNLLLYKGNLSVLHPTSNQWIQGRIEKVFHMLNDKFIIKWNNRSVLMENKFGSLTTTFQYENHSRILAEIKKRPISFIWPNKYDLHVYSDHFPDCIYFLAIAIKDNINRGRTKG